MFNNNRTNGKTVRVIVRNLSYLYYTVSISGHYIPICPSHTNINYLSNKTEIHDMIYSMSLLKCSRLQYNISNIISSNFNQPTTL